MAIRVFSPRSLVPSRGGILEWTVTGGEIGVNYRHGTYTTSDLANQSIMDLTESFFTRNNNTKKIYWYQRRRRKIVRFYILHSSYWNVWYPQTEMNQPYGICSKFHIECFPFNKAYILNAWLENEKTRKPNLLRAQQWFIETGEIYSKAWLE